MSLQRFLVRKDGSDVFIWTELKSQRTDLLEVWAESAEEARKKEALPDHRTISIEQLERMKKEDLLIFASVRLGLKLDAAKEKGELQDEIKAALFTRSPALAPAPDPSNVPLETRPFRDVQDIRAAAAGGHAGDRATIDRKFAPPPGAPGAGPKT